MSPATPMSKWTLKERLAKKELTVGSWLNFGSPLLAEMMARAGFDWLVVDLEHGTAGLSDLVHMVQVIELAGVPPLVRVGANDPRLIKQAMDAGACGVVVPMVSSVEEARTAADALYYPPKGKRGVGLTRAHDFGMDFESYRKHAQEKSVLVVQIEHEKAVDALPAILDIAEVDAFIVGPYDLSGSLNKPGAFDDPDILALMERISDVVRTHPKPGGYHVVHSDRAALKARIDEGCRFLAYGTEMIFLAEKLRDERRFIDSLRGAL